MSEIEFEHHFHGRGEILDLLKKRVGGLKEGYRQNVALIGYRHVGKTAVLQEFLHNLDDSKVTPVYLDLENKDIFYFFQKFSASLLYHFLKNRGQPVHDDLNLLLEEAKPYLPETVEVIRNIQLNLGKGKMASSFFGLMTVPEIYTYESGQFCVLIFDEFQVLDEFGVPDVFTSLSSKIMTQKNCLYILSSSYKYSAQKILAEKLSLLFGNFEMVEMDAFDHRHSQDFIEYLLEGHQIGNQLCHFLTEFTGGYPLYLQLVCREVMNLRARFQQSEIYLPLIAKAVENTLFDRWGVISRHFELIMNELCLGKGNRVAGPVLIALANGLQRNEELLDEVDINKAQLTKSLRRLQDEGIIFRNGKLHYFKDKLFRYWIKFVFQRRLNEIELTPDKQRQQFRAEFQLYVENFQDTSQKAFSSRILELLNCLVNESLDLNGRKYRLPSFRDLRPATVASEQGPLIDVIQASTDNSTWLIVLKEDGFQEQDVSAIVAEAKKLERKPEKCLIISLSELDQHTRLRALQERFWIWNEEEIKALVTLFDKPSIMR
ncbi:MAG: ATP-binding protein [Candidatus Omnitrophica bacterium]|nr:ATP-binding protein [Candidatus Omnitrophota bacterium]MCB9720735.1 ATP-binding protein [Candidatus Omnitrophota bacterium]